MLRCVPMFHNKCIQTWKASCKSEPNNGVCPQCRKPLRKLLCITINRGRRSHATMVRPSSSHELDSILVPLELPVSIHFQTIIYSNSVYEGSIQIHHILPICFSSTFDMQFLLYLPYSARARLARVWINWNHLQFYKRNPFKNESDQKKSCQKIETAFHFTREIPLKFFGKKFFHYFLQGNPFTIFQKKK